MTQLKLPLSLALRKRRKDHDNISANQLGLLVDVPHRLQVPLDSFELFKAQLSVSVLSPPEL